MFILLTTTLRPPSTLIRFRLNTHTFLCVFADVHTNTMENGHLDPRKRRLSKTPSKAESFENGCLSYQCGRSKTIRKRQCGRGYLYPFSFDQKRRHTKTDQCRRSLLKSVLSQYPSICSLHGFRGHIYILYTLDQCNLNRS